jgi:hypothetical protein
MSVRKRNYTANWKNKHYIACSGELTLEEAMDLSQDTRQNEWMNEWMSKWMHEWIYSSPNIELCDSPSTIWSLLHAYKRQYILRWKTKPGDLLQNPINI